MRISKKLVCLLVLCSLSFLLFGCWLGDDDDDEQFGPITGAIKLSAVADAGVGNAFAASGRDVDGLKAAAIANKFVARIKIGAARPRLFSLERSDNGQTLTLDATLDGVSVGKQQLTIEIVASGVADADPILKTIATATVAAGQTNEDSVKNASINYETTAKAIAYEAWPASGSKTIDDFTPAAADITTLANTIQTTLGGSIDGTKTLSDTAIKDAAKDLGESVPTQPAVTLSSISLNPTTGSVATNGTFNLATVVVTATYSDASTKTVTGHTWSVKSGGGILSGSTYTPPTTAGTAVLTCTFIENGVTMTADLTVTITVPAPVLTAISLNPTTGSVVTNGTFDLASVVVTATYSDASTKTVTGHTWSVKSGGGSLSGSTYTPPTTAGTAVLTCTFIENGVTMTADLTVTITVPAPVLTAISLNPTTGSVVTNGTFNLASVVVTATYSDASTKAVTGHTWSVKSGGGILSGSAYTPPTTAGSAVLTCTFIENDVTMTADLTLNVTASITSVELVNVPAGTFQRDANAANLSTVSAFRMSKYEITREQFLAIMDTDPSYLNNSSGVTDPVQMMNWYHAIAFCNKLSIAEGLIPAYAVTGVDFSTLTFAAIPTANNGTWDAATCDWSANGYRLPTEMEWMWAAMGATLDSQPGAMVGGVNVTGYTKAFAGYNGSNSIDAYAWYSTNSSYKAHPAGTKLANELGLYDMSGNVWEWCWDWYSSYPANSNSDYRGAGTGSSRVLRGGGWHYSAGYATVAFRSSLSPDGRNFSLGFRVVRP